MLPISVSVSKSVQGAVQQTLDTAKTTSGNAEITTAVAETTKGAAIPAAKGVTASNWIASATAANALSNVSGITKFIIDHDFERFAQSYTHKEPDLLFICEYYVNEDFHGLLVAWERFYDSTHYEIYKKNFFTSNASFERILFLGSADLEDETKNFLPYVREVLGITHLTEKNICIALDTIVKKDRIYEYEIIAYRVPKTVKEVDYDMALKSKDLTNEVLVAAGSNIDLFTFSRITFGSKDLAWILALLNEKLIFFGRGPTQEPLVSFLDASTIRDGQQALLTPKSAPNVMTIFFESTSLFGAKNTFSQFLKTLKGLPDDFVNTALEAVDDDLLTFTFEAFRDSIRKKVLVFDLALALSETSDETKGKVTALSIVIPAETGTEVITSISGLSKILKFINDIYIAVLYSQDNIKKLEEIAEEVDSAQDPSSSAFNSALGAFVSGSA